MQIVVCIAASGLWATTGLLASDADSSQRNWHQSFLARAKGSLGNAEEYADILWRRFADRMGFQQPRFIAAYRGYANSEHVWIKGRLLANKPSGGPKDDDSWWDNLRATYERWESDEIPGATVSVTYGAETVEVVTDSEGYYDAVFELAPGQPQEDIAVARYPVENRILTGVHKIYMPSPRADYMVISDMDDTVIHTGITNILVSAQLTFLYNAKTRKPLLGVGELYRSLALGTQGEPHNPVFYVSNSAWNMFDLLRDFLDLNDLPAGPLLLRDIGFNANSSDHKIDSLRRLLSRFPELSAVLVGDSGQHDAAIYATAAREFPGRVRAIYIRDVDPETDSKYDVNVDGLIADSQKLGIPFLRVRDSSQIADHARTIGLVSEADISEIEAGVELDRQRDSVMEEATKPSESDKQ